MSHVMVVPESMEATATDLAAIGDTLKAAHLEAAGPTLTMMPAAADEVSGSIAYLFSRQAEEYQKLAGEASAFHERFVQQLTATANTYANAEAANASWLKPLTAISGPAAGAVAASENALSELPTMLFGFIVNALILALFWPLIIPGIIFLIWWQSIFFIP